MALHLSSVECRTYIVDTALLNRLVPTFVSLVSTVGKSTFLVAGK